MLFSEEKSWEMFIFRYFAACIEVCINKRKEKLFPISYSFVAYNSIRRQLHFAKMLHAEVHLVTFNEQGGKENRKMQKAFQEM